MTRNPLHLHDRKLKRLEEKALTIREDIIKMLLESGSGHTAGSLGMVDVFVALYFHALSHDPKKPDWPSRDRLILSNGHIAPVRYATMAHAGYFKKDLLKTLRKFGSPLQGHPEHDRLPGLETTSGPLGEGASQAAGMAYSAKMDNKKWRVYCLLGDGELNEGQNWESFLFASKYKLGNLTYIIDRNFIQLDGNTEDICPLEPLDKKLESFGLNVISCAGNNIREIVEAIELAQSNTDKPTAIIANTTPGCGVSFMENDYTWHGKTPNKEQAKKALQELKTLGRKLTSDHK
jgi:transketolase